MSIEYTELGWNGWSIPTTLVARCVNLLDANNDAALQAELRLLLVQTEIWNHERYRVLRYSILEWLVGQIQDEGMVAVLQMPIQGNTTSLEELPADVPLIHTLGVLAAALGTLLVLDSRATPSQRF
jgi:hypothetical protein